MNTYNKAYAACLMAAKQSLPYGLGEAEDAVYKVLWTYHSMTPATKATIHRSVMEHVKRILVADNGGYPLCIEGGVSHE